MDASSCSTPTLSLSLYVRIFLLFFFSFCCESVLVTFEFGHFMFCDRQAFFYLDKMSKPQLRVSHTIRILPYRFWINSMFFFRSIHFISTIKLQGYDTINGEHIELGFPTLSGLVYQNTNIQELIYMNVSLLFVVQSIIMYCVSLNLNFGVPTRWRSSTVS